MLLYDFESEFNINLNLLDSVVTELAEIKRIISRVFPSEISKSLISIPFEKVHSEYVSIETKKKNKKKIDTSKKKKSKQTVGPPQRLRTIPGNEKVNKESEKSIPESNLKNNLQKQKPSIKTIHNINSKGSLELDKLKPPPPPPKVVSSPQNYSIKPSRKEIISELKEIFVKRGIVR